MVLVVEDDPINAVLTETVLRRDGHRVLMTGEGAAALDIVARRLPDLVLLDLSLAGSMTGLDVCRAIRANPATARIPVLVVSGWTFESDVAAAHAAGADGYLAKPIAAADLQSGVKELIDRAATSSGAGSPIASASATAPADHGRSPRPPGRESA